MFTAEHPQRILIIDDEPANLRLAIEYLRDYGFTLMTAISGKDGLLSAREGHPDLILLDINMPELSGFEVCRRLQEEPNTQAIPVVFLTALDDTESKLRAFEQGGLDYITKPFDPRELLARVLLQLDRQRLLQRLEQRLEAVERQQPQSEAHREHHPREDARALDLVITHLRADLGSTPTLDALAHLAGTNRTTLNQKFQLTFGMSVFDWLREERLAEAKRLLRHSSYPILQIAQSVGYRSHAGLTTAFRQRFGLTPRDYRSMVADVQAVEAVE